MGITYACNLRTQSIIGLFSVKSLKNRRSLIVFHRHDSSGYFHVQSHYHPRTIEQAQNLIKEHDNFHLTVRLKNKKGRNKKQRVN